MIPADRRPSDDRLADPPDGFFRFVAGLYVAALVAPAALTLAVAPAVRRPPWSRSSSSP